MVICIATVYSVGVVLYAAFGDVSIRCINTEITMLSGCDETAEWKTVAEIQREDHVNGAGSPYVLLSTAHG